MTLSCEMDNEDQRQKEFIKKWCYDFRRWVLDNIPNYSQRENALNELRSMRLNLEDAIDYKFIDQNK